MKRNFNSWTRRFFACVVCGVFAVSVVWADQISVEQAAEIAARFTNDQPQLSKMHKAPRKASNMRLAHKALQNNSADAAFYVFNQESDNGFVIVSADDRTAEEVLGYTENGSFDAEHINPNLQFWLNRYAEEITVLQTIDDSEFIDEPAARKAKQVTAIPNLLVNSNNKEITWDQLTPYNNLCPTDQRDNTKCYTGCVATAASQIMYKWAWPTKGTGSSEYTWKDCMDDDCNNYKEKTLTVNPGNTTYDWDNMLPGYSGKSYTTTQATAVATLMYHAGVAAEMNYGGEANGGSGAWTDQMAYGLKTYFGYKFEKFITMYSKSNYGDAAVSPAEYSVTRDKFTEYFNADLEAGRPILMGGEDTKGGGHEFVCCGRDANNKFYINWGWEGDDNGYYAISSLKPSSTSYNFSTNLDALIGLEPDNQDLPKVTVTWSVDGVETPVEFTQKDALKLPANPANCESGKVFVGWTANSSVDGSKPADLFTSAGSKTVTEAITYYAVFADAEGESGAGEPEENKYTFTSKAWADATNSWSSDKDGGQLTSGQGVQVTATYTGAGATTKSAVENVSKVTVNYCTNATKGAGSIDITVGSTKVSHDVTKNGGTTLRDLEFAFNNVSGKVSIVVNCTTNSIYVNSVTITSGSGSSTTYSNYSLTCGTPCVGELTSITLNTTNVKKTFTEGDEFTYAGLVVTANYDGCDSKTVTPTSVSTPDMSTAGNKTVTVSYTENEITKQKTYEITVNALPTYAIRFFNNGVQVGETQNVKEGQKATKPATDPTACDGYTFAGWWTAELAETNTEAKTWITDFTVSGNQDYYAAYSHTEEGEGGGSAAFDGATAGKYKIYADVNGTKYYAKGTANSSNKVESTTNESEAASFEFAKSSSNFTIKANNQYLFSSGSNSTNVGFQNAAFEWSIESQGNNTWRILGNSRVFALRVTNDYQTYGAYSTTNASAAGYYFNLNIEGGSSSTTYYTTAPNCTTPTEVTVTFNANGGEGEMSAQVIPYNEETALNACTFTREGHSFAGWASSEMGDVVYADKAKVTLTKNTTLYAKWAKKSYDIIINQPEKGTIATSPENTAEFESAVTITFEPNSGYKLSELIVKDASDANVPVSGEGNTRTFTMPASNVTISATVTVIPEYTISFYNNALLLESEKVLEGGTATAPSSNPVACDGYTFTGWVTENNLADDNTDDPIYATEFTATQDQNYYAVFSRTEGGGEEPVNTKYTFNSKSWGDETNSWSKDKDGNSYNNDNQGVQVTTGSTAAGATTKSAVENVSKVVVRYCTNKSSGEGSIDITVGSTEKSLDVSSTGGTTLRNLEYTFDKVSGRVSIKVNCTTNSIYVNSITITTGGSSSTTYYTTQPNCVECTNKVTIVKGTSDNGSFTVTEGVFENCKNSGVVVNITDITPDEDYQFKAITQTGISEGVTIDQEAKTVSYAKDIAGTSTINVIFEHKPVYTITFVNNGTPYVEENVTAGKTVNLPTNPTVSCEGYTFVGWWGEELNPATTEAQKWITSGFEAKNDTTYYAIYKEIVAGSGESEVASVTFKTNSSDESNERASDEDIKKFLIESNTGVASFSGSKTYLGVNGLKLGSGSSAGDITLTLNASASIKKVIVNGVKYGSDGGELKVEVGDEDFGSKSPAANLEYVAETPVETDKITVSTTSKRAYVSSIRVIAGGGSTTYYSSTVSCGGGTDVENASVEQVAVKALMNGQIVIIRGDAIYSITGARIK